MPGKLGFIRGYALNLKFEINSLEEVNRMECNILIGGEAGMGLATVENILVAVLSRLNFHFFATKNYMSRIRGGHNFHMFRIADHEVNALGGGTWDFIIALDDNTERQHGKDLAAGGLFISRARIDEVEKAAKEQFGDVVESNPVIAGIVLAVIGCGIECLADAVSDRSLLERLSAGARIAKDWSIAGSRPVSPRANPVHYRFDANQALALGAIIGGCQFMAAYPMTPSTSIMMYFTKAAQELPIHFEQAEDEISAVNMALGASYAGLRSLVATSGGGFALMQEGVSLAGMTETPIVIMEAQRPGPSTGLPTRTEQGDLFFILHSGHGEFPRAIFAPGSIEESISIAAMSFELADRYQVPVFIMTDQYFADSIQIVEGEIPVRMSSREYKSFGPEYRRYSLNESGISPLACPGMGQALVHVDSDEHDEHGRITEDPGLRTRMVDKRMKKLEYLSRDALKPTLFGPADAGTFLVCWGSNKMIVKEAVERLAEKGKIVAALHFSQVYPLAAGMISGFGLEGKRLIGVENNATGQFCQLLKRDLDLDITDRILKYDGACFTVDEICRAAEKIMEEKR
jgi:2-oxoglutarate ferredoxin oxidoreductase subunit alpha